MVASVLHDASSAFSALSILASDSRYLNGSRRSHIPSSLCFQFLAPAHFLSHESSHQKCLILTTTWPAAKEGIGSRAGLKISHLEKSTLTVGTEIDRLAISRQNFPNGTRSARIILGYSSRAAGRRPSARASAPPARRRPTCGRPAILTCRLLAILQAPSPR